MLYLIYCIGSFIVKLLPHKMGYALAEKAARIYYTAAGGDKEALRENLRVVLGNGASESAVDNRVKGIFVNFAKYLIDFFKLSRVSREYIDKNVRITGLEIIDKCLSSGKGMILVTAHLGNWELGGAVLSVLGYPVNVIALEHADRRINAFFVRQRTLNGIKLIPLGVSVRQSLRVLRSPEILGIVADKDYTGSSEPVKLFGKTASFPRGAAVLGLKMNVPIACMFMVRNEDDSFSLTVEEMITGEGSADRPEDVRNLMERYLAVFEKYIKKYPDQWYSFEKIWKREATTR